MRSLLLGYWVELVSQCILLLFHICIGGSALFYADGIFVMNFKYPSSHSEDSSTHRHSTEVVLANIPICQWIYIYIHINQSIDSELVSSCSYQHSEGTLNTQLASYSKGIIDIQYLPMCPWRLIQYLWFWIKHCIPSLFFLRWLFMFPDGCKRTWKKW